MCCYIMLMDSIHNIYVVGELYETKNDNYLCGWVSCERDNKINERKMKVQIDFKTGIALVTEAFDSTGVVSKQKDISRVLHSTAKKSGFSNIEFWNVKPEKGRHYETGAFLFELVGTKKVIYTDAGPRNSMRKRLQND